MSESVCGPQVELEELDEEFRSFKDSQHREHGQPVNQSRLTEMYQQLRVCTFPNMNFTSSDRKAGKLVQLNYAELTFRRAPPQNGSCPIKHRSNRYYVNMVRQILSSKSTVYVNQTTDPPKYCPEELCS
ncbi:hypothetical protein WMY93_014030 [Mugilogobius chulae]|uniref:Uncharacterized protein n=1 Tax=Mugilogobius chulae TaxID=88201 RepID=A0AAW0NTC8_9GOBI